MEFEFLHSLCDMTGLGYKEANFVLCQAAVFIFSFIFGSFLGPRQCSPTTRHAVQLICGLLLGIQAIGWEIVLFLADSTVCYVLLNICSPKAIQRYVPPFAILFLSVIHIWHLFLGKGVNNFDCVGPLMVLTEKVGCLAWSLHDGMARSESELNTMQKRMVVRRIPSMLEFYSFVLYPQSFLIGPITFYADYAAFIDGSKFEVRERNAEGKEVLVYKEPSPAIAITKKMLFVLGCAALQVTLVPKYPMKGNVDEEHIKTSIWNKLFYLLVSIEMAKMRFFFGWVWGDAINNAAGLGFNGYDEIGKPKWDGISNIDIWNLQFATNLTVYANSWNKSALIWLRHTCYDRAPYQRALLTFVLSASWHGFYAGYFICFVFAHVALTVSKKIRYNFRHHFQGTATSRLFYDMVSWAATVVAIGYIMMPFHLVQYEPSIKFYNSFSWLLHIIGLTLYIILPGKKKSSNNGIDLKVQGSSGSQELNTEADGKSSSKAVDDRNGFESKKEL